MSWITLVTVLVAWPLVGLGVAYLFGRLIHREEILERAGDLAFPMGGYLRRVKRVKTSLQPVRQIKARHDATRGRRSH